MDVLILGAGCSGLACAFELQQNGIRPVLLEAQNRMGGRCMTIRGGARIVEDGHPEQVCAFDEGLYLNPGPARIPQHHVTVDYCRRLGVALEPFVNRNYGAFLHSDQGSFSGRRVPVRDMDFDLRGRSFELLFRALRDGSVGGELGEEERQTLLGYLASYAAIDQTDGTYTGRDRRSPETKPPALRALLASGMAWKMGFFEEYDMQPTMLQVVGGVDRLTEALASKLQVPPQTGCVVRRILATDEDVCVIVERDGKQCEFHAERCVVTLPLPVLAGIETNLSSEFSETVAKANYEPAVKVGLETENRWWESDCKVYGGMTFTDLPSTQAWYPSSGFGTETGVLLGAYNFGEYGSAYSDLTPNQRVEATVRDVESIHGRPAGLKSAVSVAWRNVPWARGAYALRNWSEEASLAGPHPRLRLAGEHMSERHGWLAGALESGAAASAWVLAHR